MSPVKGEEQRSPKCRKKKENAFVYIWCPDRNVLIRDIQRVDKINMISIKNTSRIVCYNCDTYCTGDKKIIATVFWQFSLLSHGKL